MSGAVVKFEPPTITELEAARDERVRRLSLEFGQRIVALVSTATITVVDQASCQSAVNLRQTIGAIAKEIQTSFKPDRDYYHKKHVEVCNAESALLEQLFDPKNVRNPNTIDGKLCNAIQAWVEAEDVRRRAEEDRLQQALKREADARAITQAAVLEPVNPELAAAMVQDAIETPAPTVSLPSAKSGVTGLKTRRVWRWKFSDGPRWKKDPIAETPPDIFVKAFRKIEKKYLTVDVPAITKEVNAFEAKTLITGIDVYYEDVPVR